MSRPAKLIARLIFWTAFLAAAVFATRLIWTKLDPLRNHPVIARWWLERNYAALSSRDPAEAVAAWQELERCYLSKWHAYDWVVWRVKQNIWQPNDPLIHFHLEQSGRRFQARAIAPSGECRTVTEALMAILHQEPGWNTPRRGDWRRWWDANWTAFPNRELRALPSGPEDPAPNRGRR